MMPQFVTDEKIAQTSSKGNQEKWRDGERWYKLDQFGYEALAETLASMLLEKSRVEQDTPFTFVRYRMEKMTVHGRARTGCSSANFLRPGEELITLSRLYRHQLPDSLGKTLRRLPSDRARIAWLAETTAELTGLDRFPQYLTLLFEFDALILNDDRHLNNLAVLLRADGRFDYCPIFDNGAGFLSNVQLSPMDIDAAALARALRARPFQTTFNRQVLTARGLYGPQLQIPKFTREELSALVQPLLLYYPERDRGLIAERACRTVLLRQRQVLSHVP